MLIRAYRVQLRDSLERRFIRYDYENKQTNKQMKKQTWRNPWNLTGAVTQPQQRDGENLEILILPQWLSVQCFL